jgi:ribokinase
MYDLVSIGDIKLDVFISLNGCKNKCGVNKDKIFFDLGEKISTEVLDQQVAGSAPNVAIALARMDKRTAVISNMGDDLTHQLAIESLHGEGVATRYIKSHARTNSAYSAVLSIKGEKTILASYIKKTYSLPKGLKTKWLYMSEMGNGYEKVYEQLIKQIKKERTLLGFNPGNEQIMERKPVLYKLIKKTAILFVNVEEGQRIVGSSRIKIKSLAQKLFKLGPKETVITDGQRGAYAFDGTNLYFSPMFPGPRVEATGAGDSFAAAYIGARMHGLGMQGGLQWGSVNAASVVNVVGPTPGLLRHTQIKARLRKNPNYCSECIA